MEDSYIVEGDFWFPEHADMKLRGRIVKGETDRIHLETPFPSFKYAASIQDIENTQSSQGLVLQADIPNSLPATFIVMLNQRKENFDFANSSYMLSLTFEIVFAYYGHLFNRIEDIKFESIIVEFKNLEKWITYHDSIYTFNKINTISVEDNTIKVYYSPPITEGEISPKTRDKILYIEIKPSISKKFEDFFHIKNVLQDFFNFFITGYGITTNSVHGSVSLDGKSKLISIGYKKTIHEKMNKSQVVSPFLVPYEHIHSRFESLINRFASLKRQYNTAYSYYFSEIYVSLPLQLRFFLIAGFLESYHDKFCKDTSSKIKENREKVKRILEDLSKYNLEKEDENDIKNALGMYFKKPTLTDRLKEIFYDYQDFIWLINPILSFLSLSKIGSNLESSALNDADKGNILLIITKKKELDPKTLQGKERYRILVNELMEETSADKTRVFLEYIKLLSVDLFPQEIAKLRNMIAHVKEENQEIPSNVWYYAVRSLEFVSQLCILSYLKFELDEISSIFCIGNVSLRNKIAFVVTSSIYH